MSLPARSIFRLVAITVVLTLLIWYVLAIASFAGHTYGFNNRFTEVAVSHHWSYLLWSNVDVLKGYLLVAVGFITIIYPMVLKWHQWRPFGVKGVIWRSALLAAIGYGVFIMRVAVERPYFGDYSYMEASYGWISMLFGKTVQDVVVGFFIHGLPVITVAVVALYYLNLLRERIQRTGWPRSAALVTAAVVLALGLATAIGLNRQEALSLAGEKPKPKPKNILIIGSDSLRGDHLSCNGYHRPTSPSIDKLAAQGVNFSKCLTPIASTLESLTSFHSSQYPNTHGIFHMFPNKDMVKTANAEAPSLAGALKKHGYDTAVIGDWCACGFNELPMGFEDIIVSDFDNFRIYMSEVVYLHHQILPLFFDNRVGHMLFPKMKSFANYMTPDVVTDQVIGRLRERAADEKPFLIFAYYSCTHLPYKTPREYSKLWTDPDYKGKHKHELSLNVDEFIGGTDINAKWSKFPKKEVAQVTALYDGCVRMFDDCVGRVVHGLEQSGLADSTVVLVMGDHGDDLFEPGTTFGHGMTFNGGDQNNHIPAVMRIPGYEDPGRKVNHITRSIDLAPTLLELVGVKPDPRFQGHTLTPYLQDSNADMDLAFFGETSYLFFKRKIPGEEPLHIPPMDETTFIDPEFDFHFVLKSKYQDDVRRTKERTLRTERFKLCRTPGMKGPIYRLFDLAADPHCERDVKADFPEVTERMSRALDRWANEGQESRIREVLGDIDEQAIVARK
jgi:arylsulfatase A-like enzyme